MAKQFEPYEIESAASTLVAAQKLKDNGRLHSAAIKLIKKEQKITEKVISES